MAQRRVLILSARPELVEGRAVEGRNAANPGLVGFLASTFAATIQPVSVSSGTAPGI
jgi:hypothetical protein